MSLFMSLALAVYGSLELQLCNATVIEEKPVGVTLCWSDILEMST